MQFFENWLRDAPVISANELLNMPSDQPRTLGLITNGLEFMFVNLERQSSPIEQGELQFKCQRTYALSMEKADEFEQVFRVLKQLPRILN